MNIFKKVIASVTVAALCVSSVCVAFADDTEITQEIQYDANYTYEAGVLETLGISGLPSSGTWDSIRITKGEFLKLALQLSDYDEDIYYETTLPYADVTQESTYYNEFAYAYINDMLYGDEYMYPDDSLTRYFAVEVVRGILGYNVKADGKLVWNKSGIEQQIVKGVTFRDMNITSANGAVKLLYNALGIDILQLQSVGPTGAEYRIQKDVTVLSDLKDIHKVEGRMQATPVASVNGMLAEDGSVVIDGEQYQTSDEKNYFLLGAGVRGYYKETNGKRDIILLDETDSVTKVTVDAADITDLTANYISYYKDGKSKKLQLKKPVIIYNGRELGSGEYAKYQKTLFNIVQGNVTLFNSGSGYDLMIIRSFKNLAVASKREDGRIVYDSLDNKHNLSLDKDSCDLLVLSGQNGNNIEFDSISAGGIVTYAKSLDGKVIEAVYGGMVLTAAIDGINNSGSDRVITVSGKKYTVLSDVNTNFDLGVIYNLYINAAGYVCGVEESTSIEGKLGYVIDVKIPSGLDSALKIKMIDSNAVDTDDAEILQCSDKLIVDGTKYTDSAEAQNAIMRFNGTKQLPVVFKTSADGKITSLDTPYYDSANEPKMSLTQRHSRSDKSILSKGMRSWGYRNLYDGRYYLSYGGMCLLYNSDGTFFVAESTKNDKSYNMDLYSIGDETYIMCFAVADDSSSTTEFASDIAIVEDVSTTNNSKGNETVTIKARVGSKEQTFYVAERYAGSAAVKGIETGDVLRYKVDGRDEIFETETLLKYSDKDSSVGNMNYPVESANEFRVVVGKVYSVEDDPDCKTANGKIISYFTNPNDIYGSMESLFIRSGCAGTFSCERGNLVISDNIDINKVLTYQNAGDGADVVITTTNYLVPTNIYVIK